MILGMMGQTKRKHRQGTDKKTIGAAALYKYQYLPPGDVPPLPSPLQSSRCKRCWRFSEARHTWIERTLYAEKRLGTLRKRNSLRSLIEPSVKDQLQKLCLAVKNGLMRITLMEYYNWARRVHYGIR
jgi:hypothetical protein